jgi:DNA-binding GntR family transcriptional regulator
MSKREPSEVDRAYDQICRALLQGKLRSGTQLRERQLAEVFGLTRGAVRKVLARLSAEGKVESVPNRGAFVPQPTSAQVRELYSARKAVEAGVAGVLAKHITPAQLQILRAHTAKQRNITTNSRETTVLLSVEFHIKLSQMIGSAQL